MAEIAQDPKTHGDQIEVRHTVFLSISFIIEDRKILMEIFLKILSLNECFKMFRRQYKAETIPLSDLVYVVLI